MIQHDIIMEMLRRNPLKNITLLKMLTAYHQVMDNYLIEQEDNWGILLLLPADAFAYDLRAYPDADTIVLMDYSSLEVLPALIKRMPKNARLVFKLQEEPSVLGLSEHYPLRKVRRFYSYSTEPGQSFTSDGDTVLSEQLDERLLPLWAANGYSREEIVHYFEAGAFSVSLFKGEIPLSTCFVFRNEEQIWEIGGVHTAEEVRKEGLALRVVRTAVFHTLQRGYIPRYQVQDNNVPSIRLAESLGLQLAVKLTHWINYIDQPI
ncbi:FR47-like protein [compost metagenome]